MADELDGSGDLPHPPKMTRNRYEPELLALQIELVKAQYWVKASGERVVSVQGPRRAGKGGTIKRFREHMNPRGAPRVALAKPTEAERASGTSSATSASSPPPARSPCSTAPGTTGPVSSGC